jgi:hypothetical protein
MRTWIFLPVLFFLSGCIEIVEEITIHPDKSGTISYRLETTEAGSFLSGLAGLFNVSVDEDLKREAEKLTRELEKQEGISNIQYNLGGRSGEYFLQFDFNRCTSFNNALYSLGGNSKTPFSPGYIKIGKSHFKKFNFSPWLKRYIEKEEMELPSTYLTDNIVFKSVVNTPADIIRVKHTVGDVQSSPRKTIQQFLLTDLLDGQVNSGIRIRY